MLTPIKKTNVIRLLLIGLLLVAISVGIVGGIQLYKICFRHKTDDVKKEIVHKQDCDCKSTFTYKPNVIYGIDISKYQEVDWKCLSKKEKISFVYVRASYGKDNVEPKVAEHVKNADKFGFPVGLYHFFVYKHTVKEQFRNFDTIYSKYKTSLIPVLDIEEHGMPKTYTKTKGFQQKLRDSINIFMKLFVEKHPNEPKPIIYSGQTFYTHYLYQTFNDYKTWIANYRDKPQTLETKNYWIWQFSDSKQLCGINGNVDMDVLNDDISIEMLLK